MENNGYFAPCNASIGLLLSKLIVIINFIVIISLEHLIYLLKIWLIAYLIVRKSVHFLTVWCQHFIEFLHCFFFTIHLYILLVGGNKILWPCFLVIFIVRILSLILIVDIGLIDLLLLIIRIRLVIHEIIAVFISIFLTLIVMVLLNVLLIIIFVRLLYRWFLRLTLSLPNRLFQWNQFIM